MAKKLFADGVTGDVVIYQGDDDVRTNPLSRLEDVFFHSALSYMSVVIVMVGQLALPQRTANNSEHSTAYGDAIYTIGTHGLGYTPMLFGWIENLGIPLTGDTVVFGGAQASFRSVVLGADDDKVYIRERYLNKHATAPAQTLEYRIWLFEEAAVHV